MSREAFYTSANNPNDTCGGGGCACDPSKVTDCKGPYTVFPNVETDSGISPYVVVGATCLRKATAALDGEVLAAGETGPAVEGTVVSELPDTPAHEIIPEV